MTVSNVHTLLVTSTTDQTTTYVLSATGSFPDDVDSFTVESTAWGTMEIWYDFSNSDNSAQDIQENLKQCQSENGSIFSTTGSFDMETAVHDYEGVNLGLLLTDVICGES